ncbi:polar amino acid transport system substrate-binding protein [Rhodococcus wratislaviensis]|uniref:ABC transporter substrate-binding protein n=2 Tax=Rhodococcus wratislaviensis TaxID=44752 RepID=A0AB38F6L2_RHOWR|nr:glutamate ABC transporter substrate-binding protein [Rhodococcus wratislaviensis]REE77510.1 polar amino acid transport system substrate-binding protein [Rhodococcus wratislaviensis]GAF49384.1 putative ABC transporter substrate-binding protein [Rhodococcus wratislaviensis NBRC 100605]SPZ35368.1 ABC transporter substrate-binding protein [Rhodococcus wratislaviensis]
MTRMTLSTPPTRSATRHRITIGVSAIAATVLTACAAPDPLSPITVGTYTRPMSGGAQIIEPLGTASAEPPPPESCGALASLRPGPQPTPGQMPLGGSLAEIAARGRLIVGIDQNTNLLSFRDPDTGTLQGFDVDIAREIAHDIFGDPAKIEFRLLTSAGRFTALENNDVDVVVHSTSITCERAQRIGFSTEYLRSYQRLLVPKGSDITGPADLAGKRVCSFIATTSLATVQRVAPQATIIAVPDWDDCLVTLQKAQADAASTSDTLLAGFTAQDPELQIVGPPLETEHAGIGVNKDRGDLVQFVNGTLDRIRADGTWMRIYNRWLATGLGPVAGPPPAIYRD